MVSRYSTLLTLPFEWFQGGGDADVVKRLTDSSQYTGSHKSRFDESGKGKGIEGRKDIVDSSGYVGDYKNAGTYDKAHKN